MMMILIIIIIIKNAMVGTTGNEKLKVKFNTILWKPYSGNHNYLTVLEYYTHGVQSMTCTQLISRHLHHPQFNQIIKPQSPPQTLKNA